MAELRGRARGIARRRAGSRGRARTTRPIDPDELAGAIEALAVLLDAGVAPPSAWTYAGEELSHPLLRQAAVVIGEGRTPPGQALADAASRSEDDGVRTLAAVWAVAEAAGAALAPALRGAADALRDRAETARDIEASMSGPRATARLTGWMPVIGLLMAVGMGVDVVGTLLGTPVGWVLLGGGVALMLLGRVWTRHLVAKGGASEGVAGTEHDLMAIALAGGASLDAAKALIAETRRRTGLVGGDPASLDRVLRISERAGAPAAELLLAAARQERRASRAAGRSAAATLAVRLLLPLGACVLPAFLLLGVAPVVVSLLSSTVGVLT